MEIEHQVSKGFTLKDLEPGDGFHTTEDEETIYMLVLVSEHILYCDAGDGPYVLNLHDYRIAQWASDTPIVPVLLEKLIVREVMKCGK